MLESFIKFGFSAGVLDPRLHGRGDLRNYDLGLAEGRNWCIHPLGGAYTRPGTEFRDFAGPGPGKLIPFQFNRDTANTYLINFDSAGNIRFLQGGDYVLESAKAFTASAGVYTSASHGYSNNDWVKINGGTYQVTGATTNTFTLVDMFGAAAVLSSGNVARIYTISHPYSAGDLAQLKYSQDGDVIYLNHSGYAERKLTRSGATSWALTATDFEGYNATVNASFNASGAGSAGTVYVVVPVNAAGQEALPDAGSFTYSQTVVDITATAGYYNVGWSHADDAEYYNVYRTLVYANGPLVGYGNPFGLVATVFGRSFVDENVVPDFTQQPLEYYNPFADGAITGIEITAIGSGYSQTTASVSISGGGGSGFIGVPVIINGTVTGIKVLNAGSGYSSPTVTIAPGGLGGTGATATAQVTPTGGNFPCCSAKVQQRRVRGGTSNNPLTIYGSRIGAQDVYYLSGYERADDPYILTIDAETQTPIRHIIPSNDGFFAFCDDGVFLVRGVDDSAITSTSAKASPQTSDGASHVPPVRVDREVLYITSTNESIKAISPSNLPTYFTTVDRSVLSSHFFRSLNPITSLAWAKAEDRQLWLSRNDGTFLSCAYLPEQEVNAWSNHTTKGFVEELVSLNEDGLDRIYLLVRRTVNGTSLRFIERLSLSEPETEEDMWAADCAVRSSLTYPAATLTASAYTGTITVTANSSIFSSADEGKVFRAGGGRGVVTSHISATQLTVELDVDIVQTVAEFTTPQAFESGSWSLTEPTLTFSGLAHLEGEAVDVLADGVVVEGKTVSGGSITLDEAASYVLVGLGYTGRLKTLPPSVSSAVLENREKNVRGIAMRLLNARGLEFGDAEGDITYPLPDRDLNPYTLAPRFKNGLHDISIRAGYDFDGTVTVHKLGPQSATVLGLVLETDIEG